ncbi:MAG: S49 family peptidase [Hydrogenophilales bacterium 16-64-46]|nr:MAG: S49 family peptidase [Hydrogenophilales bacterium 12-64-13]OYZ04269.1 MAG: S49 family peptidase [Hydrogenophilales bacterium 16-64-46]OZA38523.1 MAG: S49 family peptidase [Hydrogenophilales bacterium 17-64-34]HQT00176.1 S49 family peptidase [Thiobacillus sp.]
MSEAQKDPNWERQVLEKLAMSAIQEQRRTRHWGILFKTLGFLYLFVVLFLAAGWFGGDSVSIPREHTALVDLQGVIASEEASADAIIASLQGAFEDEKTKGVILRINSPGGSPVQAGQIYDEIKRLRKLHPKTPLYAVVDDICASGGYYVAAGADRIFVDKASIVGSIGVLMDGFGFTQTMEKLGVERRLLTAGENKGFLDPFSPVDPTQQAFAKQMLEEIHGQFIGVVREGRGKRLKETPEMFSGLVWSGEKSIELGLADALGSVDSVARDVIKAEDIVDYTQQESFAERLAGRLGAAMASALTPFEKTGVTLR